MGCGIQKAQVSLYVGTLIQIGLVTKMTGSLPQGLANLLEGLWCVGHPRSTIAYLSQQLNLNMWLLQVLALSCYG